MQSCKLLFIVICISYSLSDDVRKDELKNKDLPLCQLCRTLVGSFKKGMEGTAKSNFQGGDTAWEEEKMGVYAMSEVRLIEIQENLCSEVERGRNQCHRMAEEVEHRLEEWWFKNQNDEPDLYKWLCVDILKHCCPSDHYGLACSPCPGFPSNVCSGNGKCRGSGTRKGNGTCNCDEGYEGLICESCAMSYYESYRDQSKLLCSKCHSSCLRSCTQAGPKGCIACNSGWLFDTQRGCVDINECVSESSPCEPDHFCVNNEGSFTCLTCDRACKGCHGDGPDMCDECAFGYLLKDGMCADEDDGGRGTDTTRYFTYMGLTVATCIIFQKNPVVASLIGVAVAIYVTVSEYMLGMHIDFFWSSIFSV